MYGIFLLKSLRKCVIIKNGYLYMKGIVMRIEFLGKHCPVCRGTFKENDNVVVCPVCGTPHHRDCYEKENKCGVEEYHAQGFEWNGYLPDEERPMENQEKAEETAEVKIEPGDLEVVDFFTAMNDTKKGEDGVSMKELTAYTSTSLYHYTTAFQLMRAFKRKAYFNICSGFFAPMFQFYRKMDLLGFLLIALTLLPSLLAAVNENFFMNNTAIVYVFRLLNIAEQLLLCFFGDYLYYRHAVKQILKIRGSFSGDTASDEYYLTLNAAGKPSFLRAIVGTLILAFFASLIIIIPTLNSGI